MKIIWIMLLWILCVVRTTEANGGDNEETDDVVTAEVHMDGTSVMDLPWSVDLREEYMTIMKAGEDRFLARREEKRRLETEGVKGMTVFINADNLRYPVDVMPDATVATLRSFKDTLPIIMASMRPMSFGGVVLKDDGVPLADAGIGSEAVIDVASPPLVGKPFAFKKMYTTLSGVCQVWRPKPPIPDVEKIITKFSGQSSDGADYYSTISLFPIDGPSIQLNGYLRVQHAATLKPNMIGTFQYEEPDL